MNLRALVASSLLLLLAGVAAAQLNEETAAYFDGPAGFLMTKEEQKAWEAISSQEEAERFIELFWARRDPDLGTRVNEFKQQFDLRVTAADQQYSYSDVRGAMTDRGKTLILLGPCDELYFEEEGSKRGQPMFSEVPGTGGMGGMGSMGGRATTYTEQGGKEFWQYNLKNFPGYDKDTEFHAIFLETNPGMGDYLLSRNTRHSARAIKLLGEAPQWYLVNPDLEVVPEYADDAGSSVVGTIVSGEQAAAEEQLAWLGMAAEWMQQTKAVARPGFGGRKGTFLWVQVLLPEEAPQADTAVGRLRSITTGAEAMTFVSPVVWSQLRGGRAYELAVPTAPGGWQLELALATGDQPLTVVTLDEEIPAIPEQGTTISPLNWGCEVARVQDAAPGSPFVVGSWHVHPRADYSYEPSDSLAYTAYVFNPQLGKDGEPRMEVVTTLSVRGEEKMRSEPQPAHLTKLDEGVWVLDSLLSLEVFKRSGYYRLGIELTQPSDGSQRIDEIPLHITVPQPEQQTEPQAEPS